MRRFAQSLSLFILCVLLTSCGALRWSSDYHTVRAGETIYSIARKYNLEQRDIIRWNNLGDGSYIREGQKLRVKAPYTARNKTPVAGSERPNLPVAAPPAWRWPADGQILLRYRQSVKTESGIRIAGTEGQPIIAAAPGEIVYAGDGLASYGQLLIIKHNESWLSAYGFNSRLLVSEGDKVRAGQAVANMGRETAGRAQLHFEIRRNGQPVDPLQYLPVR